MLFPQLGPEYYDEKDRSILTRMEVFYAETISINQFWWAEAAADTRAEAGDVTLWNELYPNVPIARRSQFSFNRIRRIKNMIGGYQRKNRKSTIVTPVENGDSKTADQFTKVMMWCNNQENVLETISEAFDGGAIVTGMNLLQVWMDWRSDPVNGNIKVDACAYNSFLIDPYFRKHDLSDCNGIWKRSYLTKKECISLMPDKEQEILGLYGNESNNSRDAKFQFMPEAYGWSYKNLLIYDEFYYRDYRTQKLLVDTQTGETQEWKSDDDDALQLFLATYPTIQLINSEIPTVRMAIVIQGKVMYDGPNPLGIDCYPFVPVLGYYNPQMENYSGRIQGVVRNLRDAQYLYNRRRNIELDILESQITSGYIYKENALVNPNDVFLQGQGRGLALKAEANMTDVLPITAPQVPPSMIQLSELLAKEVSEISGVSEELLGSASDDVAGVLSMLRQGAGLTTLQILFDQLDRSQKMLGQIMIQLIQTHFTPGKIKRIIEDEPTAQFYNKSFGRYDAVVEEGLNTSTQRQMQFAQMLELRTAGVPITTQDMLEAATIQNKNKIIENALKQERQVQQAQQMQMQSELKEQEARINLTNSRAMADQGLGLERISRVEENKALAVERVAEAEKDREMALLNFVKALKELEGIDLMHLEKLVALSKVVKEAEHTVMSEKQPNLSENNPDLQPKENNSPQQAPGGGS